MTTGTRDPYHRSERWKIEKMVLEVRVNQAINKFEEATGFQVDSIGRTTTNKALCVRINDEKGDYGKYKNT